MSSPRRRARRSGQGAPGISGSAPSSEALRRADAVLGLNPADRDCVLPLLRDPGRWIAFPPFLDARSYAAAARRTPPASPRLIAVAMMRHGDKLASYRLLGAALAMLLDLRLVAGYRRRRRSARRGRGGAGPARTTASSGAARSTRREWPPLCRGRPVRLAGDQRGVRHGAARSAGERAAGRGRGERRRLRHRRRSARPGCWFRPAIRSRFAAALRLLIRDPDMRAAMGAAARERVRREHDLPAAASRLGAILAGLRPGARRVTARRTDRRTARCCSMCSICSGSGICSARCASPMLWSSKGSPLRWSPAACRSRCRMHPDVALVQLPPLRARDASFALIDEAGAPIDDRLRERRRGRAARGLRGGPARCGRYRRLSRSRVAPSASNSTR